MKNPILIFFCLFVASFETSTTPLFAQQNAAKKEAKAKPLEAKKEPPVVEVGILVEFIELDHYKANELIREHAPHAADAAELREILDGLITEGDAELLETTWVRAKSGNRAKTESIREEIYATEFDPPEMPANASVVPPSDAKGARPGPREPKPRENEAKRQAAFPLTSAVPTAFETRNIGTTLEVDPVVEDEGKLINLSLAPEMIEFLGRNYFTREGFEDVAHGIEHLHMPVIYAVKTTTQISTRSGAYNLLSINTPHGEPSRRIFVILKADIIPVK